MRYIVEVASKGVFARFRWVFLGSTEAAKSANYMRP
jgi:hypothetical protein